MQFGSVLFAGLGIGLLIFIHELGHFLARITSVEWFNTLGESVTMVTGLIFVVCVLAFRRGIMGEIIAWLAQRRSNRG